MSNSKITSNENIKNSKSRLLRLSSEDKTLGDNGRFTIDILSSGGIIDNVKGYIVHSMQCPNVFDNIPTYANTLTLTTTAGAVVYTVTVPNSYYYFDDFIVALQTAINASIPDSVVVAKTGTAPTQQISFTFTGDAYTLVLSTSTIASRIGLLVDLVAADGVATAVQSIPNLIGETEVYAHSRVLAPNNLIEGSGSFSVIDKLNLDKQYGDMCYQDMESDTVHFKKYFPFESLKTLRTIRITLRNRTGQILTLPANFNFTMMLMLFYK
tara:strand:+ start:6487 stop:7290 length:804 start_codon:yes stop_codon:yes gene_type:complete